MKNVTAQDINELSKLTGKSMLECKKILLNYEGSLREYMKSNFIDVDSKKLIPTTCPHC